MNMEVSTAFFTLKSTITAHSKYKNSGKKVNEKYAS
jgi:hypothetical protein